MSIQSVGQGLEESVLETQSGAGQESGLISTTSSKKPNPTASVSDVSYRQWTVISAGASMEKVTSSDLLKGPVVAINRAISIRNRVPIHIWAVWDHPQRLFDLGYDEYIHPPLQIWLGPNRFQEFYLAALEKVTEPEWEKHLHPEIGLRCMPMGAREVEVEGGKKGLKSVFTAVYAIEKMVSMGARKIRVLGADMEGSWVPGKTEEECVELDGDRWSWERDQWAQMEQAAEEIGVEIERR